MRECCNCDSNAINNRSEQWKLTKFQENQIISYVMICFWPWKGLFLPKFWHIQLCHLQSASRLLVQNHQAAVYKWLLHHLATWKTHFYISSLSTFLTHLTAWIKSTVHNRNRNRQRTTLSGPSHQEERRWTFDVFSLQETNTHKQVPTQALTSSSSQVIVSDKEASMQRHTLTRQRLQETRKKNSVGNTNLKWIHTCQYKTT